ncbi:hypothetical protein BCEP4_90022 [Burkholderia cepacia]|nr:hypothetical protein BCEP4_90022 [Burkholderia cepacia]
MLLTVVLKKTEESHDQKNGSPGFGLDRFGQRACAEFGHVVRRRRCRFRLYEQPGRREQHPADERQAERQPLGPERRRRSRWRPAGGLHARKRVPAERRRARPGRPAVRPFRVRRPRQVRHRHADLRPPVRADHRSRRAVLGVRLLVAGHARGRQRQHEPELPPEQRGEVPQRHDRRLHGRPALCVQQPGERRRRHRLLEQQCVGRVGELRERAAVGRRRLRATQSPECDVEHDRRGGRRDLDHRQRLQRRVLLRAERRRAQAADRRGGRELRARPRDARLRVEPHAAQLYRRLVAQVQQLRRERALPDHAGGYADRRLYVHRRARERPAGHRRPDAEAALAPVHARVRLCAVEAHRYLRVGHLPARGRRCEHGDGGRLSQDRGDLEHRQRVVDEPPGRARQRAAREVLTACAAGAVRCGEVR